MTVKKPKRPRDPNQLAKLIVDIATGDAPDDLPTATDPSIKPGRPGGLAGGRARASKLSDEQRADIARKAAQARWAAKT